MVLAAVAAVPGVARDISVYFWKAGPLRTTRSADRFAGLTLPPGAKAGFLADADAKAGDAARRYYEALYAFAPSVLLPGAGARLVVADVADPTEIGRLCARYRLHVVARAAPGVALLERD